MDKTPVSTRQWKSKLRRSPISPSINNTSNSNGSPKSSTPKRALQSPLWPSNILWSQENNQQVGDVVWDTNSPNAQKLCLITTGKTPVRRKSSTCLDSLPCKKNIAALADGGNSSFAEDLAKLDELVFSEMQQKCEAGKETNKNSPDQPLLESCERLAEVLDESDDALSDSILRATQQVEEQYFKTVKELESEQPSVSKGEKGEKVREAPLLLEDDDMDLILCNALDSVEGSMNSKFQKPLSEPEGKPNEDDFFQPEVLEFISQIESTANLQRKATAEEIEKKRQEALKRRRQRLSASK